MKERKEIKLLLIGDDYEKKVDFACAGALKDFRVGYLKDYKNIKQSFSFSRNDQIFEIHISGVHGQEIKTAQALIYFNLTDVQREYYENYRKETGCILIELDDIGPSLDESLDKIMTIIQNNPISQNNLEENNNRFFQGAPSDTQSGEESADLGYTP